MERTNVCPHESAKGGLAGSDDLLAVAERDLQVNRSATVERISATLADTSVQKTATHPLGSSTSTTRIAPLTAATSPQNVLYRFFARLPYKSKMPVIQPRRCPARLANSMRLPRRPEACRTDLVPGGRSLETPATAGTPVAQGTVTRVLVDMVALDRLLVPPALVRHDEPVVLGQGR